MHSKSEGVPVALVNMPFSYARYPSIQLGTLSALLKAQGIGVKSHYLNVAFAHQIGVKLYEVLCEKRGLLGEWLFSRLLFRENPKHDAYVQTFKPLFEETTRESGCRPGYLEEIEARIAPDFLMHALASVDWGRYQVVGFTSTFDQNVASLTMAKLIKDFYPDVAIVFGGANFDGQMGYEYFRAFPWIDYVVVGEGEYVFPDLVRFLLNGKESNVPPGAAYRRGGEICFEPNTRLFNEFEQAGPADYDDYFEQVAAVDSSGSTGLNRILLYEGSRGCWWGEKHHCTFCGLNAQAMKFRAKSPDQVAQELDELSSRYDATRFRMVDNIIDMKYIENLFAKFAADRLDYDIFIETKSNLSKQQIQTLAHGGVKCMQPGLESLSQATLKEMDKGVSPLQNIQCLKWSAYYHVEVSWNILLGFPGETDEDYRRQIELIPALVHFQPPESAGKLWLERFSPYFTRPEQYGIAITGPGLAYEYVYDPRVVDLKKIAYDFEYEIAGWKVDPALYDEITNLVRRWQQRYASNDRPFLYYAKSARFVTIYDGRGDQPRRERYDWPAAFVIEYCNEAPKTLDQIRMGLEARSDRPEEHGGLLAESVDRLVRRRILYEEKGRYFTLALPMNPTL